MCKTASDFTSSTTVSPDAGGINCNTLNTFLLGKFSFTPLDWTDTRINCTTVKATNWVRRAGQMYQHLWYFGPSCCGGIKAKVRYAECVSSSAARSSATTVTASVMAVAIATLATRQVM